MFKKKPGLFPSSILVMACVFFHDLQAQTVDELEQLSIEQLMEMEVTSVSKKPQKLSDSAAAIHVITQEDIRRSGATNIPDALRMVPGMHVARIDSNKWAVTSRGFNGRYANKLLVLIDGRSVYTPTFSGVYWETEDVFLEDVERIEVIRGPGATLWGANAVNGVINIITKHAADTQGGMLVAGGGTVERGFGGARYGARLGEGTYGRAYVKGFKRDEFTHTVRGNAGDDWDMVQGGFRLDTQLNQRDALTVLGSANAGNINQGVHLPSLTPPFTEDIADHAGTMNGNVLARWQRILSPTSELSFQTYYDHMDRSEVYLDQTRDTFDMDFQHRFAAGDRHDIIWGAGYRYTHDDFSKGFVSAFEPSSRGTHLFSLFLQDDITLVEDRLRFIMGSKFEHNDYSGIEFQPSARLLWTPHPRHSLWAAVSRAVRTPSRTEHDLNSTSLVIPPIPPNPLPIRINPVGNDRFDSEKLLAFELGYRATLLESLSLDIAAFYNLYDEGRGTRAKGFGFAGSYVNAPWTFVNNTQAETLGAELAVTWQAADWWLWQASYSYLDTHINFAKFGVNPVSPEHQMSLRSNMSPREDLDVDLWFRFVDSALTINSFANTSLADLANGLEIDSYATLDARVAWRPVKGVELSLVGQNLLDDRHPEYVDEGYALPIVEVPRGVFGKVALDF
jgi:iron complex outermembrane receptor protein